MWSEWCRRRCRIPPADRADRRAGAHTNITLTPTLTLTLTLTKAPPLSAYLCFAHATRLKLVEEAKAQARADGDGPGQGGSSFSSAIERQLGKAWKELGVEEKKQWENQAVDNRDRYTEECRAAGVEPKAFPHALLLPNRCTLTLTRPLTLGR